MYIVTEEEHTISLVNTRMLSGLAEQAVCDPDNIVTVRTEDSWLIVSLGYSLLMRHPHADSSFLVSFIFAVPVES